MNATQMSEPTVARWRYAVWLLLGLFVVAHGCHGDKDTELFTRLWLVCQFKWTAAVAR
jgi:hypothetical protein